MQYTKHVTIDDPLYHVDSKWYRLYWWVMLCVNLAVIAGFIAVRFVPALSVHGDEFTFTHPILIISCIALTHLLSLYWLVKRASAAIASVIGTLLTALMLLSGINATDPSLTALGFAGVWFIIAFFNGMYGLPMIFGAVVMVYTYILTKANFQVAEMSNIAGVLIAGASITAVASYFFWRSRFISEERQTVDRLSGMLQSNMQQSEILIHSIADGAIMIDTGGKVTLMNPAAATMTEWQIKEAIGMDVRLVVKLLKESGEPLEAEQDPFTIVFSQQRYTNQILQLEGREGRKVTVSLSVSPVILPSDKRPRGAVAVMRDVSEERAAEKQRGEFISTASHEMRTPVAAIEGYLALALNDKVSTIDSRARGFLEKAHASTQHLGKLFQDLLTSSKAEDGRLSNHPMVIEMGAFMQQLTDDLKFTAEKKGLVAEFVIGGANEAVDATTKDASTQHLVKPLYYVNVDPDRIREVITNLFDNACKYTDSGKISIGLTGNHEVVQLYVRDTGAGIPAADIPHLFQKFYRVDSSATRTVGGTGLGLFISRKIVELYNGRIWVESGVGKGSTFFINLPRLTAQHAAQLQAAQTAQTPPPSPATTSITGS